MSSDKLDPISRADRPTSVRWYILVLIGAASWLLYLHRYAWGVVKSSFRKENPQFTDQDIGWLDSAFLATYACGQIPGGLAGDVFGPRLVLGLSILFWSLAVAGVAATSGYWPLFAMLAVLGLSQAGAYPAVSKVTRSWFPASIRTRVQGAVTALGRLGGASAPFIIRFILIGLLALSWRGALLTIALPGVLLALAFWVIFRNSPREHPWTNRAEEKAIEELARVPDAADRWQTAPTESTEEVSTHAPGEIASTPSVAQEDTSPVSSSPVRSSLHGPARVSLVMLLVYSFFSTFADMLYVFWIPSFLVDGKGLSGEMMSIFAPLPLIGGAIGGVVGGTLNDLLIRRTGNPRLVRSGVALTGKSLAALLIVVSLAVPDGRLVMVLLLGCKFFGDWSLPTQWGTITDMAGKGAGTVFGIVNTIGSLGGFAAGPLLGYLKQHYGWEGLFLGVGVAYLAAALCWLFIDCTQRLVYSART